MRRERAPAAPAGRRPVGHRRLTSPAAPAVETRDDLASLFRQAGLQGTFVLYDVTAARVVMVDRARAERRFIPASTFNVA
ncbi:hypothetical protein [Micromonospora sp. NPDC047730]|uniref:hypothetical protein n=1 Tax=Micromonospora sp. NPDC047730 TaxID=3364253 RepID=UPI003723A4CB